jgi:DNA-binding IclR family transcriptional regulator
MTSQIQVIDRAVQLLQLLGASTAPMRLGDVATRADLTPSTTRRILASLIENGLCEQAADGGYRLGLGTLELGHRAEAGLDLRERSAPVLERLARDSHLTSFLCVRHEQRAICIERVDGRYAFSLALTVGGSLPLHAGAAPRALLAYDGEDDIRRYLRDSGPLERFTEKTIVDPELLIAELRESRERGWVVSDEDVTPSVAALAMAVFGHGSSEPIASVSVAGLLPQVLGDDRTEQLVCHLREAADELSRALGHRARPAPRIVARTSPPEAA